LDDARRQEDTASGLVKGQNYFRAGRWAEAMACFEAVLELEPGHRDACQLLEEAKAQERARLEDEARQAQQARDARLRDEVLQTERTRLYDEGCAAAREKDWSKAIKSFEAVLKTDPDYLDAADRLARARAAQRTQSETSRQQDRRPAEGKAGAKAPQGGFDRSRQASDASADGVAARFATPEDLQDLSAGDGSFSDLFGQLFGAAAPTQEAAPGLSAAAAKPAKWQVVKTLKGHTRKVCRAAFSPDGKWVVTASEDKTARVWEVATGRTVAELRGHEEGVNAAAFSPDGILVATASDDGRARVWQAATGQMVAETKKHGTMLGMGWKAVIGAAFFPDGSAVATTASDGKMRIWEPGSGKLKGELEGQEAFAVRAYCSPGVHGLLVEHKDGWGRIPRDIKTAKLWNALRQAQMGKFAAALSEANLLSVPEPSFRADGKRAITAHDDGLARVWEVASGTLVRELSVSKDSPVRAVAFHPGGMWVATVAATETEKVLTADTAGRWVATPSGRETVKVWNVDTGRVVRELGGHLQSVNCVAFSFDGKLAVTASDDWTALVWQVPAS
jgi:WD40 repeat protein